MFLMISLSLGLIAVILIGTLAMLGYTYAEAMDWDIHTPNISRGFGQNTKQSQFDLRRNEMLPVAPLVQPVCNVDSFGKMVPSGYSVYHPTAVTSALISERSPGGNFAITLQSPDYPASGATYPSVASIAQGFLPYSSDGASIIAYNATPNYMRHVSAVITAAGDGSVAAVTVIGQVAAVKFVLYDTDLSGGLNPDQTSTLYGILTLSDSCGYIGRGGHRIGPIKQGTANTNIQASAGAGVFGNAEALALNISYRAGA